MPLRDGKGSRAALEGATREHGGVLREQEVALLGSAGAQQVGASQLLSDCALGKQVGT